MQGRSSEHAELNPCVVTGNGDNTVNQVDFNEKKTANIRDEFL